MLIRLLCFFGILMLLIWGLVTYSRYRLGRWLNSLQPKTHANALSQKLVKCAYCGVFVPTALAYQSQDQYYCSQEHSKI